MRNFFLPEQTFSAKKIQVSVNPKVGVRVKSLTQACLQSKSFDG